MKKIFALLIITIFTLANFVFVEASAYEEYYTLNNYNTYTISSSDKKESKITKRKTRAQKRREKRRAELLKQKEAAANQNNETYSEETKEFYEMNPIIKPLKNNYDGSTRSKKPSTLKSNYYQSQNN